MNKKSKKNRILRLFRYLLSPQNSFYDIHLVIAGFIFFEAIEDSIILLLHSGEMGIAGAWIVPLYSYFTSIFTFSSLIYTRLRKFAIFFNIVFFISYFIGKFTGLLHPLLDQYMYGIYFYMLMLTLITRTKIIQAREWNP